MLYKGQTDIEFPSCQQDVPKSSVYIGSADAVGRHRTQIHRLYFLPVLQHSQQHVRARQRARRILQ
jgi:hypothetical protein